MEFKDLNNNVKNSKWLSLLAGFIGASLPSIAILYAMTQVPAEKFEWPHINFFLGMFIMGGLGSFLVAISGERNAYKALPLGGGAPALINSAGTVATVQAGGTAGAFLEYIGTAVASVIMAFSPIEVAAQTNSQPNPIVIQDSIKTTDSLKMTDSITIVAIVENSISVNIVVGIENRVLRGKSCFKIPRTDHIYVGDFNYYDKYKIPQKDTIYVKISLKKDKEKGKKDFLKGFFAMQQTSNKREFKKYRVEIK